MIKYNETLIATAYSTYRGEYLRCLATGAFEKYNLQETAQVGICRKTNTIPKSNIPFVYLSSDEANTTNRTVVLCDGTGVRDLEADLRYVNTIITALWEDPTIHERFITVRKFATRAYVNWVGRGLMNRFNINFQDKVVMDVLLAIYYYSACGTPSEYFANGEFNAVRQISEAINIPVARVVEVINDYKIADVESTYRFADCIVHIQSISDDLKSKITVTSATAVLSRSWYGEGGTFYSNLAVEYPPMFLTLLYFALVSTDFKRTNLANVVKEFAIGRNTNIGEMYVKQFNAYVQGIDPKVCQ